MPLTLPTLLLSLLRPVHELSTEHLRDIAWGSYDPNQRKQIGLKIGRMFPALEGKVCSCGCGMELTGRRHRWATNTCSEWAKLQYWLLYGDTNAMWRALSYTMREPSCAHCGWHGALNVDHIAEVAEGGGACGLDNIQYLCTECHKAKTAEYAAWRAFVRRQPKGYNPAQISLL